MGSISCPIWRSLTISAVKFGKGQFDQQFAVGDSGGGSKGACLNAVRHDGVVAASEPGYALDPDSARAVPFDVGPGGKQKAKPDPPLRARGPRFPAPVSPSARRAGHERSFGAAHGREVEMDPGSLELYAGDPMM